MAKIYWCSRYSVWVKVTKICAPEINSLNQTSRPLYFLSAQIDTLCLALSALQVNWSYLWIYGNCSLLIRRILSCGNLDKHTFRQSGISILFFIFGNSRWVQRNIHDFMQMTKLVIFAMSGNVNVNYWTSTIGKKGETPFPYFKWSHNELNLWKH